MAASQNSFQALNVDVPAPDSSVASGAGVALASPPQVPQDAQPDAQASLEIDNALGLAGTPMQADKGGAKRPRAVGSDSGGDDKHDVRQEARRTDPMNPFRVGDQLNPFATKYKIMCEKNHQKQVIADGHEAAAIQFALDHGFHPDRVPFDVQPDEDMEDDEDFGDTRSPTNEAMRLKLQCLARPATESRHASPGAQHANTPAAAKATHVIDVDAFEVDANNVAEASALPPPLGTAPAHAQAHATRKSSKNESVDDGLTAEECRDVRKINEVFGGSTILLKIAPAELDIEGRGPQWALANVSRQQAADWGLYDGPHFLIVVPGPPMGDEMRAATTAALQSIIERTAPAKAALKQPQVAPANAEDTMAPLLNIFFAHDLDENVRDGFHVSTGYSAGRDNTIFYTFGLCNRASPFIYTLYGLTLKDPVKDSSKVAELVSTTLACTETVRIIIIKIKPSLSPALRQLSDDALVDYFLASIRVSGMRMVSPTKHGVWITQWNIYMDHAHLFQSQHRALRTTIAAVPIVTSFYGTSRMIKKNWYCATCMSISHPTGLCPFTALPGWANTSPPAAEEQDNISTRIGEAAEGNTNGRGGSRGGRGGSRGGRGSYGGRGGRGGGKF